MRRIAAVLLLLCCSAAIHAQGPTVLITPGTAPPFFTGGLSVAGGANFAGARISIHNLDPTEVDVFGVTFFAPANPGNPSLITGPGFVAGGQSFSFLTIVNSPFGPTSNNVGSSPLVWTVWHPNAVNSGVSTVSPSIASVALGPKGTNLGLAANGDIDLSIALQTVVHIPMVFTPGTITFGSSNVQSFYSGVGQPPGQGTWVSTLPFHSAFVGPGFGSTFFALSANAITYGVEHVPEPSAIWFGVIGCAFAGVGQWFRRRRLRRTRAYESLHGMA